MIRVYSPDYSSMKITPVKTALILMLAVLFSPTYGKADLIILKNGKTLEGLTKPTPGDPDKISITTIKAKLTIPKSSIKEYKKQPLHHSYYRMGQMLMDAGNYEAAKDYLDKSMKEKADYPETLKALKVLEDKLGRIKVKEVSAQQLKAEENFESIKEEVKNGDFKKGQQLLLETQTLSLSDEQKQQVKDLEVEFYFEWAQKRLDHVDEDGAKMHLEKAVKLNPLHKEANEMLIKLYEKDPTKVNEVLSYYQSSLKQNPDNKALHIKVANALMSKQRWDEAITHYSAVYDKRKYAGTPMERSFKQAFEQSHQLKAQNFKFKEARDTYLEFTKFFPGEDPSVATMYEYRELRQKTGNDDIEAHAKLGEWCRKKGMSDLAIGHYKYVLSAEPKNQIAMNGIMLYANASLINAEKAYTRRSYLTAINISTEITEDYMMLPDIVQKAAEIHEKSRIEYNKVKKTQLEQAENYVRNGDQNYNQGMSWFNQIGNIDTDTRSRRSLISPRHEATKFFKRAIKDYDAAAKLDREISERFDLNNKIRDCEKYIRLLNRKAPPLPRKR